MIRAFKQATPVLERIERAGYEAYFVGGSVRDFLLKKENEDVDIATSATPDEIKNIFQKTIDVGIEHGTVIVLYNGQTYEITTFRSESDYEDFRRPKNVKFIRSLYEDLKRRDFTMNAIAMNREGNLIDPFFGYDAIKSNIIQTVGKADERFSEDALRMMRAVRFVSQLSFTIEKETFNALKQNGPLLENISVERKTKEFEKLLSGKDRRKALQLLTMANLHQYLPGLNNQYDNLEKFYNFSCETLKLTEMWALLVFTLNLSTLECLSFLKDWRVSNLKIKEIEKIIRFLQKRFIEDWCELTLYHAGEEISVSTERIYNVINGNNIENQISLIVEKYRSLPIKSRGELAVTGQDLMNWQGNPGGPWLKELLEKLEQLVLLKIIGNDKEAIREWLLSCNPK